ncbi:hypothetical protein [Planomonospora sp. ID82291]|uniref:hypothetical protein n=1 Tax=Planomonospora sp. ID82291 TaxID=2738136 RepID=UPI0018C39D78|nr:hypothetical protein [Planomonospora sp. ID82291]MBG0814657.1 hypothetical protein [Planomonospora sp. ID82291]
MKITIHGTQADIDALPFRRLRASDGSDLGEVVLVIDLNSAQLRKDPYSDAYRLCVDLVDPQEVM